MDFPTDHAWQFPEFAKTAIEDFYKQCPSISLLDEDVSLNWEPLDEPPKVKSY
jgi:hypothetical protein